MQDLKREELYELVWKQPMTHIAKEYGLSGRGLAKLCERNSIPVPPRGYWARITNGKKVAKPPLVTLEKQNGLQAILKAPSKAALLQKSKKQEEYPPEVVKALEKERSDKSKIFVPKRISKHHPIISAWLDKEAEERRELRQIADPLHREMRERWITSYSSDLQKRRLKVLSVFIKALERRGYEVRAGKYREVIEVAHGQFSLPLNIDEYERTYRRPINDEDRRRGYGDQQFRFEKEKTGKLRLKIPQDYPHKHFIYDDEEGSPLEDQLNEAITSFVIAFWRKQVAHEKHLEYKRRCQQQEQEEWKRRQAAAEEKQRREGLLKEAMAWNEAEIIRGYISHITKQAATNEETRKWANWALTVAEEIDPTIKRIKTNK